MLSRRGFFGKLVGLAVGATAAAVGLPMAAKRRPQPVLLEQWISPVMLRHDGRMVYAACTKFAFRGAPLDRTILDAMREILPSPRAGFLVGRLDVKITESGSYGEARQQFVEDGPSWRVRQVRQTPVIDPATSEHLYTRVEIDVG